MEVTNRSWLPIICGMTPAEHWLLYYSSSLTLQIKVVSGSQGNSHTLIEAARR